MNDSLNAKMELRYYEKHVACILCAVLLVLSCISIPKVSFLPCESSNLSVHVVGAVQEKTILVPIGSTVDDVLQKIELFPKADLLEIDGNRRLMRDSTLVIPFDTGITLYVTGSVASPQVLVFETPATATEILSRVQPLATADYKRFKRKRVFKTGMVVEIPERKEGS